MESPVSALQQKFIHIYDEITSVRVCCCRHFAAQTNVVITTTQTSFECGLVGQKTYPSDDKAGVMK
jgi:hypothetical protein